MTIILKTSRASGIKKSKACRCLSVACAALLLISSFVLAACSTKTPYEVLEDSVVSSMNAYRYADRSVTDRFIEYMDISELEQFDIDPQEFTRSFFADFDYTIDSISVEESSAKVALTLISKDYLRFEEILSDRIDDMEARYSKRNITSDKYKEMYGDAVMESMDGVDTLSRYSVEIDYMKDGNTWHANPEIFYTVMNALVPIDAGSGE